jgi:hypothetical protein
VGRGERRRGPLDPAALVVLPLLAPALLAGGFLAFASAIGEYGTPLVIGQRIGYPVVATEIARLVGVFPIDLSLASALGATLLVVGAGAYGLSRVAQRSDLRVAGRSHYPAPAAPAGSGRGPGRPRWSRSSPSSAWWSPSRASSPRRSSASSRRDRASATSRCSTTPSCSRRGRAASRR